MLKNLCRPGVREREKKFNTEDSKTVDTIPIIKKFSSHKSETLRKKQTSFSKNFINFKLAYK